MIQTFQYLCLGVTFDIKQMDAETALHLQESALKRMAEGMEAMQQGDYLTALCSMLGEDTDSYSEDAFLAQVKLNGTTPDYDTLFAGRYEELSNLYARILEVNYGFLLGVDERMFLGPTKEDGSPTEPEEATPTAVQRAQAKFSQPQMIYSVIMSDKRLATLHELQTIYNLEDLYKLYECVAFERHTTDIYRKKAEQQRNQ
ncbi:phage tail assembly chaperone [Pseudomonas hunanensis]|uniref:phage tail assembly chaperone n=1 Tax=Pseudomonas hunanensis TaxID=1247546 RepID=UPI0037FB31C8